MENVFDLKYGVAGVCVLLTLSLIVKMIEFLWKVKEKKDTLSEQSIKDLTKAVEENTLTARHLDMRINHLEKTLSELPKFKVDLRRHFTAMKILSGERWPDIKKQIMEEDDL